MNTNRAKNCLWNKYLILIEYEEWRVSLFPYFIFCSQIKWIKKKEICANVCVWIVVSNRSTFSVVNNIMCAHSILMPFHSKNNNKTKEKISSSPAMGTDHLQIWRNPCIAYCFKATLYAFKTISYQMWMNLCVANIFLKGKMNKYTDLYPLCLVFGVQCS